MQNLLPLRKNSKQNLHPDEYFKFIYVVLFDNYCKNFWAAEQKMGKKFTSTIDSTTLMCRQLEKHSGFNTRSDRKRASTQLNDSDLVKVMASISAGVMDLQDTMRSKSPSSYNASTTATPRAVKKMNFVEAYRAVPVEEECVKIISTLKWDEKNDFPFKSVGEG